MKFLPKYLFALVAIGAIVFTVAFIQKKELRTGVSKSGPNSESSSTEGESPTADEGLNSRVKVHRMLAKDAGIADKFVTLSTVSTITSKEQLPNRKLVMPKSNARLVTSEVQLKGSSN